MINIETLRRPKTREECGLDGRDDVRHYELESKGWNDCLDYLMSQGLLRTIEGD